MIRLALLTLTLCACSLQVEADCPTRTCAPRPLPACDLSRPATPVAHYLTPGLSAPARLVRVSGTLRVASLHWSRDYCGDDCCEAFRVELALADAHAGALRLDVDDPRFHCRGPNARDQCCPAALDRPVVLEGELVPHDPRASSPPLADHFLRVTAACELPATSVSPPEASAPYRAPLRLRVVRDAEAGRRVVTYLREDTEPLWLDVTPGALVGARVRGPHGESLGGVRPLLAPESPDPVDPLLDVADQAAPLDRTYTFELFETTAPITPHWQPELSGYRVLWGRTLRARDPAPPPDPGR